MEELFRRLAAMTPPIWERPIDWSRPVIDNGDGSFSTERTITVGGGPYTNMPSIVNGVELPPDAAVQMHRWGVNEPTGQYPTISQAIAAAMQRSHAKDRPQ
ncbi:MAG: hypothetical protein GEV06_16825 [Luteitalea sp.]|nr:hypothetical protein [Luteitalea sp.]